MEAATLRKRDEVVALPMAHCQRTVTIAPQRIA